MVAVYAAHEGNVEEPLITVDSPSGSPRFLFMDESYSSTTTISALTGLLVPIHVYPAVRERFFDVLHWSIRPADNVIAHPPELHAKTFLAGEPDDRKLHVLRQIADLVIASGIGIYRVGYYITTEIRQRFPLDQNMEGACWLSMLFMLEAVLAHSPVIPVMDGFNTDRVRRFSGPVKSMDVMRAAGAEQMISVPNAQNLIGEVFYADSQYAILTQVAECCSLSPVDQGLR